MIAAIRQAESGEVCFRVPSLLEPLFWFCPTPVCQLHHKPSLFLGEIKSASVLGQSQERELGKSHVLFVV